jgi:hypothetical protein
VARLQCHVMCNVDTLSLSLSLSLCHFYFGQTTWLPSKKSVPAVTQGYFCCSAATSAHCCAADIASECVSHSADTGFRPAAIVAALCPSSASAQCCRAGAPPTQLSYAKRHSFLSFPYVCPEPVLVK